MSFFGEYLYNLQPNQSFRILYSRNNKIARLHEWYSTTPKEGTVCVPQFLDTHSNLLKQEFVISYLDQQHVISKPSAWMWTSHDDCVLFVSRRHEICINNVSCKRQKADPIKSCSTVADIGQNKISWHAVWELWLMGKGMRKLDAKSSKRRGLLNRWQQPIKKKILYKYCDFTQKQHFGFFPPCLKKHMCEEGSIGCGVSVYVCVCMQHVSMLDCETSNLPLLQNVLYSRRQLPTANSVPGFF